jgi:hypothetical protein
VNETKNRAARAIALLVVPIALVACDKLMGKKPDAADAGPPQVTSAEPPVPPAMPLEAFAEAGDVDGKTPYEQAKAFHERGQNWMGRLVLEQKALGPEATKDETLLLASICHEQGDEGCVAQCAKKLGVKQLKFDAGAAVARDGGNGAMEHKEPDTDLAKARDFVLKQEYDSARKILEPKVLDGKATKEEIRMLKLACEKQGDRMCVALCAAKLK